MSLTQEQKQLVEDVAKAVRRRQMARTGAGHAFDPEVPPTEAELDNARAALTVALEAAAKVAREEPCHGLVAPFVRQCIAEAILALIPKD